MPMVTAKFAEAHCPMAGTLTMNCLGVCRANRLSRIKDAHS